jgi:hypothetical protein
LVRDAGLLELDINSDIQTVSMAVNSRSRPQATYIGLTIADIRDWLKLPGLKFQLHSLII